MTLKIRKVLNQIKYPKNCEAQVRLVLECLEGNLVDVQVTNRSADIGDPDDWVCVCFADDSIVYFRLNQAGEFCRIEKLLEFNQRFSRLAQQRRRKILHLLRQAPRTGSEHAYQVRIIDPEGHIRTDVVIFEKRSLNQELEAQGLNKSIKIFISGMIACEQNQISAHSKVTLDTFSFEVNIGMRCFPVNFFSLNGVTYMEILEKKAELKAAEQGSCPISISIGALDIPIRELLDLRPGSKVVLDQAGTQALKAWIYLGLEKVAQGQLIPKEQGWEFYVEAITTETELFAA